MIDRIAIFGVGAMGCLFGSRLAAFADVTLIGTWAEQIETVRRDGLTVTQLDGRQTQHRVTMTAEVEAVPSADVALILVKGSQTERVASHLRQVLSPTGVALTLQNGLGNAKTVANALGDSRTAQGVSAQGATMLKPGHVRHAGEGATHLGLVAGMEATLEAIAKLFNQAGLPTNLHDDVASLVWGKLAVNAAINPLTALLKVPNGALAEQAEWRALMEAVVNEVAQVAAAQGIVLPYSDPTAHVIQVCRATAANRSSMLQDISRGAHTEIDTISGAVVEYGRRLGIPTPVNEMLLRRVKGLVS